VYTVSYQRVSLSEPTLSRPSRGVEVQGPGLLLRGCIQINWSWRPIFRKAVSAWSRSSLEWVAEIWQRTRA
jgi:hypothetical protein